MSDIQVYEDREEARREREFRAKRGASRVSTTSYEATRRYRHAAQQYNGAHRRRRRKMQ